MQGLQHPKAGKKESYPINRALAQTGLFLVGTTRTSQVFWSGLPRQVRQGTPAGPDMAESLKRQREIPHPHQVEGLRVSEWANLFWTLHPDVVQSGREKTTHAIAIAIRTLVESDRVDRARELARTGWELFPDDDEIQHWHRILGPPKIKRIALQGQRRGGEAKWLRENADDYRGKWVVLFGSELVGVGDRLRAAVKMAQDKGYGSGTLVHQVPNK